MQNFTENFIFHISEFKLTIIYKNAITRPLDTYIYYSNVLDTYKLLSTFHTFILSIILYLHFSTSGRNDENGGNTSMLIIFILLGACFIALLISSLCCFATIVKRRTHSIELSHDGELQAVRMTEVRVITQ